MPERDRAGIGHRARHYAIDASGPTLTRDVADPRPAGSRTRGTRGVAAGTDGVDRARGSAGARASAAPDAAQAAAWGAVSDVAGVVDRQPVPAEGDRRLRLADRRLRRSWPPSSGTGRRCCAAGTPAGGGALGRFRTDVGVNGRWVDARLGSGDLGRVSDRAGRSGCSSGAEDPVHRATSKTSPSTRATAAYSIAVLIVAVVVAPVVEELMFRGVVMRGLLSRTDRSSPWAGRACCSARPTPTRPRRRQHRVGPRLGDGRLRVRRRRLPAPPDRSDDDRPRDLQRIAMAMALSDGSPTR